MKKRKGGEAVYSAQEHIKFLQKVNEELKFKISEFRELIDGSVHTQWSSDELLQEFDEHFEGGAK